MALTLQKVNPKWMTYASIELVNSPLPKPVVALPLPGTTPKAVAANYHNINKNYCKRASLS